MSDILIRNTEMPLKGQMLVIFPDGTSYVCFNGMRERLAHTEAVLVPPHGDLIDRDALIKGEGRYIISFGKEGIDVAEINRAPTIIQASE